MNTKIDYKDLNELCLFDISEFSLDNVSKYKDLYEELKNLGLSEGIDVGMFVELQHELEFGKNRVYGCTPRVILTLKGGYEIEVRIDLNYGHYFFHLPIEGEVAKYSTHGERDLVTKDLNKPNRVFKLTKKKVEDWVDYRMRCDAIYKKEIVVKNKKVATDFKERLSKLDKVVYYGDSKGYHITRDYKYEFEIDTYSGHVHERLTYIGDSTLDKYMDLITK